MKFTLSVLLIWCMAGSAASAQYEREADEYKSLLVDYGKCALAEARKLARDSMETDESVAQLAIARCDKAEQKVRKFLKGFQPKAEDDPPLSDSEITERVASFQSRIVGTISAQVKGMRAEGGRTTAPQ